jgi:bacterioferritin
MGKRAREIVEAAGLDVNELLKLLNRAFADEWLAYYQYWIGAQIVEGESRKTLEDELIEHADEELEHAQKLADRIIELGGTPILEPKEWYDVTNCGYKKPDKVDAKSILKQNIEGERCAINVYRHLLNFTKEKDPVTYDMLLDILADEIEHEEDLEAIGRDFVQIDKDRK